MRYLSSFLAIALLTLPGCRSQSAPLTNPFLAPDRVPPPATRTLLPGTAQPYYPGDPVPNSPAVGVPAPAYTPGPAPTFTPQPGSGVPQAVPPGGWNPAPQPPGAVTPTSANVPLEPGNHINEQAISVGPDEESLRFASAATQPSPPEQAPVVPDQAQQALAQSVLPARRENAGFGPVTPEQPASYQEPLPPTVPSPAPPSPTQTTPARQVQIRAVGSSAVAPSTFSSDGFRPRGSSRLTPSEQPATTRPTLAPVPSPVAPPAAAANRFGFQPQYQWLRGQLQYSPTIQGWMIRYLPDGQADQFGGAMMIANPQVLGDLKSGDFVALQGQLLTQPATTGQMVPIYNVAVVQRQRL